MSHKCSKSEAEHIATIITNQQIYDMFKSAMASIKKWEMTSNVNKSISKGVAWNVLASGFDVKKHYHYLARINMVREFGEYLPPELRRIKAYVKRQPIPSAFHQDPKFDGYEETIVKYLYHGSPIEITRDKSIATGTYFSDDLEVAKSYGGIIYKVDLDCHELMRNAFDRCSMGEHWITIGHIPLEHFEVIKPL